MKSIYTAIIFFGVLLIFSLQTFAQNRIPDASLANEPVAMRARIVATTPKPAPTQSVRLRHVPIVESIENHLEKDNTVYVRSDEPDRYGYGENGLNSIARICLVPGARRCVQ